MNPCGKSTTRAALGDWLFGIPARTTRAFLHPMSDLRLGGILANDQEALAFQRTEGNKQTVRAADGSALADHVLHSWLGDMQRIPFEQMFSLDHGTLVAGSEGLLSASDDLGQMLFQSASGIEQLGRVLSQLEGEADGLWASRKSSTRVYYQAQEDFEQATATLKQAVTRAKAWRDQQTALSELNVQLQAGRAQLSQSKNKNAQWERVRRTAPLFVQFAHAAERLQALGSVPRLPENSAEIFAQAEQALALLDSGRTHLLASQRSLQDQLKVLQPNELLLARTDDIKELAERRLQYRRHRPDLVTRQSELQGHWDIVQAKLHALGWREATPAQVRQRLPESEKRAQLRALLSQHAVLHEQNINAQDQAHAKALEVSRAEEELEFLQPAQDQTVLESALEQVIGLGDYEQRFAEFEQQIQNTESKLNQTVAAMGPWQMAPDQLATMLIPDQAALQLMLGHQNNDAVERQTLGRQHQAKLEEVANKELEWKQVLQGSQAVSYDDVQRARHARDSHWLLVKTQKSDWQMLVPGHEALVQQADSLADKRHDNTELESKRQAQLDLLERLRLDIDQLQQRSGLIEQDMQVRDSEWLALCRSSGMPELPLLGATQWIKQRDEVLVLSRQLNNLRAQFELLESQVDQAKQRLMGMLWPDMPPTDPKWALQVRDCIREARRLLDQAAQIRGQRESLQKQLRQARQSLEGLEQTRTACDQAWQQWQATWADTLPIHGFSPGTVPEAVATALELMQAVEQGLDKIQAIQVERIDTMRLDLDGLEQATATLCAQIADDLLTLSTDEQIQELQQRLHKDQQLVDEAARLHRELSAVGGKLDVGDQQREATNISLNSLYAHVTDELDEKGLSEAERRGILSAAIARAASAQTLTNEIDQLQRQVTQEGDGLALEQLQQELADQDLNLLPSLKAELEALETSLLADIERLSAEAQTARDALKAFDGSAKAAEAEADRQEALARMGEAAREYVQVRTAAKLLKWSIDRYRDTHQGPMLTRASETFKQLTRGSFERLVVDSDGLQPKLLGVREDNRQVPVDGMSEGSRDQLYLSLRLAALDLHVQQARAMPFVADDLFINFDDERTRAGLLALGELSRNTQVILMTHHEHLVPLAQDALGKGLNIIRV